MLQVYYKRPNEEPELLTIAGCEPMCPLDRFEFLLSNVIPVNWDAECKATTLVGGFQPADEDGNNKHNP